MLDSLDKGTKKMITGKDIKFVKLITLSLIELICWITIFGSAGDGRRQSEVIHTVKIALDDSIFYVLKN